MLICPPPFDWNGMRGPVGGGGRTGGSFGSPAWFRSDKEWPLWWGIRLGCRETRATWLHEIMLLGDNNMFMVTV